MKKFTPKVNKFKNSQFKKLQRTEVTINSSPKRRRYSIFKTDQNRDLPGLPVVVKTLHTFTAEGSGLIPDGGIYDLACHVVWPKTTTATKNRPEYSMQKK